MTSLVDVLLGLVDWTRQRTGSDGTAESIPKALKALVIADSQDEALAAYWDLDNRVVVQGQLFEAAVSLVPAMFAALLTELSESARYWMIELMIQIGGGESHASEAGLNLGEAARAALREGLWVIYAQLQDGSPRVRASTTDLLALVDPNRTRLSAVVAAQLADDSSEEVRSAVARLTE